MILLHIFLTQKSELLTSYYHMTTKSSIIDAIKSLEQTYLYTNFSSSHICVEPSITDTERNVLINCEIAKRKRPCDVLHIDREAYGYVPFYLRKRPPFPVDYDMTRFHGPIKQYVCGKQRLVHLWIPDENDVKLFPAFKFSVGIEVYIPVDCDNDEKRSVVYITNPIEQITRGKLFYLPTT